MDNRHKGFVPSQWVSLVSLIMYIYSKLRTGDRPLIGYVWSVYCRYYTLSNIEMFEYTLCSSTFVALRIVCNISNLPQIAGTNSNSVIFAPGQPVCINNLFGFTLNMQDMFASIHCKNHND